MIGVVLMEFSLEINSFIDDYIKCIKEDCAAIFAGAGLSASSGYVVCEGGTEDLDRFRNR